MQDIESPANEIINCEFCLKKSFVNDLVFEFGKFVSEYRIGREGNQYLNGSEKFTTHFSLQKLLFAPTRS